MEATALPLLIHGGAAGLWVASPPLADFHGAIARVAVVGQGVMPLAS
jgi:hypothetical protein